MRREFIQRDRRLPRFRRNGKQMLRVAITALPRAFGQVRAQGRRERVKRPGFGHAAATRQRARGGDALKRGGKGPARSAEGTSATRGGVEVYGKWKLPGV